MKSESFYMFLFHLVLEVPLETLLAESCFAWVKVETLHQFVVIHSFSANVAFCFLLVDVSYFAASSATKDSSIDLDEWFLKWFLGGRAVLLWTVGCLTRIFFSFLLFWPTRTLSCASYVSSRAKSIRHRLEEEQIRRECCSSVQFAHGLAHFSSEEWP